ncbi:MAG: hypothetical protein AAFY19_06875 [Pseudomonadota bacterium]
MISAVISILVFAMFTGLSTLATVLLTRFFLASVSGDTRILVAGLGGPCWVMVPFLLYMIITNGFRDPVTLATIAVMAIGFIMIGWPISFFATRKLDRLTAYDPAIFE